jgi:hypothetical protein
MALRPSHTSLARGRAGRSNLAGHRLLASVGRIHRDHRWGDCRYWPWPCGAISRAFPPGRGRGLSAVSAASMEARQAARRTGRAGRSAHRHQRSRAGRPNASGTRTSFGNRLLGSDRAGSHAHRALGTTALRGGRGTSIPAGHAGGSRSLSDQARARPFLPARFSSPLGTLALPKCYVRARVAGTSPASAEHRSTRPPFSLGPALGASSERQLSPACPCRAGNAPAPAIPANCSLALADPTCGIVRRRDTSLIRRLPASLL